LGPEEGFKNKIEIRICTRNQPSISLPWGRVWATRRIHRTRRRGVHRNWRRITWIWHSWRRRWVVWVVVIKPICKRPECLSSSCACKINAFK